MKKLCYITDKTAIYFFKVWKYHLFYRNGTVIVQDNWELKKIDKMILNINLN